VLIPGADELEQHRCLGLILTDVCEVILNNEIEAIQPVDGGLQSQLAARDLQALHEVGGTRERAFRPFSNRLSPMADDKCDLPPPDGPRRIRLAPLRSQPSPAQSAETCALDTIGTASKSKFSSVLPGSSLASLM
jgi:hypothetical protein